MNIMRGFVNYSDKILENIDYENDSNGKMLAKASKAGMIEGLGDGFLILGAIGFATNVIGIVKAVRTIRK